MVKEKKKETEGGGGKQDYVRMFKIGQSTNELAT